MLPPNYEYHIFLSYARGGYAEQWVRNHLHPVLKEQLVSELGEARIFIDDEIPVGAQWPVELERSLHRSCCLLPVWSAEYFRHRWCVAEWKTVLAREQKLGLCASEQSQGLIYPVVFADGRSFPDEAQNVQSRRDLQGVYTYPQKQFAKSMKYLGFHDKVGEIARDLIAMLNRAPQWDSQWEPLRPDPYPLPSMSFPRL